MADGWSAWVSASAVRGALISKSAARVRLGRDGIVTVECDMTDIGTGSYTIISQVAAEMMGLPLNAWSRLGDSDLPETYGSGGQQGAAFLDRRVYAACAKLRGSWRKSWASTRATWNSSTARCAGQVVRYRCRRCEVTS
jgi:xanthine dehydrogenase YagR molybdenum-binding subunit